VVQGTQGSILAPLRQRSFRMLFCGQVVSNVGDWLDFLAVAGLVAYDWRLGGAALAAVTISRMLPLAVCGPFAGVWADRLPRKALMIICDLLRGALALGLIWAPNLYVLLTIITAKSLVQTLFDPAQLATLRTIVAEDRLLPANSLSMMSQQLTKVLAPLVGGLLVACAGARAAFAVDAATFLVSAVFISQLPYIPPKPVKAEAVPDEAGDEAEPAFPAGGPVTARSAPEGAPQGFWADFLEGIRYILSSRLLILMMSWMAAGFFILFLYDSFLALLARDAGLDEAGFGVIISAVAAGSIVGIIAAGQWGKGKNPIWLMIGGTALSGCCIAAAGLGGLGRPWAASLPGQAGAWLLTGLCGGAVNVYSSYLLQVGTPPDLMGRVWSIATTVQNIVPFIAPAVGAAIVAWVGVGRLFCGAGLAYVAMALVIAVYVRLAGGELPAGIVTRTGSAPGETAETADAASKVPPV